MNALDCTVEEQEIDKCIYCPGCEKYYAVYAITHICNQLARCNAKRKQYEERYIMKDYDAADRKRALCRNCDIKYKKATQPRKGKCPDCEYTGLYIYTDDDKRCPSCKIKPENTPQLSVVHVSAPETQVIQHIEKEFAKVFLQINAARSPTEGMCEQIWMGIATDKSLLTDQWFIAEKNIMIYPMNQPILLTHELDSKYNDVMTQISEWLIGLSSKYHLRFESPDVMSLTWFRYLRKKYAPVDMQQWYDTNMC